MSLVGTRPILQDELQKYELHHRARIAIKPGITGMWQVSGRSDITDFEEVVRLDTEYISNWNFGLDTGCLSIQNADRRCITVRTGWHFGYYCAWMAVARYPMMRELLIFIRETVCLCRRIQKSLRFTDRRSSLISEDKIQNSRVWGKTGR